jgi:hypothetical protein
MRDALAAERQVAQYQEWVISGHCENSETSDRQGGNPCFTVGILADAMILERTFRA